MQESNRARGRLGGRSDSGPATTTAPAVTKGVTKDSGDPPRGGFAEGEPESGEEPASPGRLPAAPDLHPVRYWLDDGLWTPAVLVGHAPAGDVLVVNLNTEAGRTVIGAPDWFAADYVALWNGLVPECCDPGTDPGQWSPLPAGGVR